jgi:hypothetical protein
MREHEAEALKTLEENRGGAVVNALLMLAKLQRRRAIRDFQLAEEPNKLLVAQQKLRAWSEVVEFLSGQKPID